MVENTLSKLEANSREFNNLFEETQKYVAKANECFVEKNVDLKSEEMFPQIRQRKQKKFADEISSSVTFTPEEKYRIEVYNVTYDTAIECIKSRFANHKKLYMDFQCLHPSEFANIKNMPDSALEGICSKMKPFFPDINQAVLRQELDDFSGKWPQLSKSLVEEFRETLPSHHCDKDGDCDFTETSCKTCRNCILCCYNVLYKYNLYANAYAQLSKVYKYMLTLSISQVTCERSFSKLKYILNRLRNNLSQHNVESFMLMSLERDILMSLSNDDIINDLAKSSQNLSALLI